MVVVSTFLLLTGCVSTPPKHQDNICHIFDEKDGWYKRAKKASKQWGIPIATNMAIMHQESRFVPKAKPPRTKILGFIPGPRKSSAYGYPQAKDETWDWYKDKTGSWGADRDEYGDSIDFVAWFNHISVTSAGIRANDTYRLYLAYHEGHGGYKRGTYKKKAWLTAVARKVDKRAKMYQAQLNKCEDRLDSSWWWPF
ncbi:transglycosylase SLT domain-containing protein [Teredinibacter purpureus]|uniref:transglycosylase SLT domain-containing protein n=1 Tax=Teredinibacter purpureus TaxID=2731756 RepID=UPI0009E24D24